MAGRRTGGGSSASGGGNQTRALRVLSTSSGSHHHHDHHDDCSCRWRGAMLPSIVLLVLLATTSTSRAFDTRVHSLACYCDANDECVRNNFTCTVDAEFRHPDLDHWEGGCVAFRQLRPDGTAPLRHNCFDGISTLHCATLKDITSFCCGLSDGPYCNRNVSIPEPVRRATTSPPPVSTVTTRVEVHHNNQDIIIPLCVLLFLCLACIAVYLLVRFKRTGKCLPLALAGANGKRGGASTAGNAHGYSGGDSGNDSEMSDMSEYVVSRQVAQPKGFLPRPQQQGGAESVSVSGGSSWTSGSGHSCTAYFGHRTLALQIELRECIGKGRYGEVHSGVWQGEDVAVKKFYARDEHSWVQESQIYNSRMLNHENILSYYGSDMLSKDDRTELWLITQFHPLGSLYDYLLHNDLDVDTTLNFVYSMASGLNHLHAEIRGTSGKYSIAHRDLKAKNILVKNDRTCCIADLGLAVMHDPESSEPPDVPTHKVGTKRYMSPEMLTEKMNVFKFHAFRCADMYSLGLVLWETVRRCKINDFAFEYSIPYFDKLPNDPDFHEVRTLIVDEKYRPPLPHHIKADRRTVPLVRIMADCWRMNPEARCTALRIKKTLYFIRKSRATGDPLPAVQENEVFVQPQAVALPLAPGNPGGGGGGPHCIDSQTYSACGPDADTMPTLNVDVGEYPEERSDSLFLPAASIHAAPSNSTTLQNQARPVISSQQGTSGAQLGGTSALTTSGGGHGSDIVDEISSASSLLAGGYSQSSVGAVSITSDRVVGKR
eukprot:scpid31989/ scgid28073/ Activin receptor type-1; Activin receptor type I; Serine/threonine-protein kinase receptor R1; TGF-B superfamily receptor type I